MQQINPALLKRYHAGRCSPEEKKTVEEWLKREDNLFVSDNMIAATDLLLQHELWQRVQRRMNKARVRRLTASLVAAAGIAAMIVCGGWYFFANNTGNGHQKQFGANYQSYTVREGTRVRLVLPDSSIAYVMGGSTIKYPEKYEGTSRDLILDEGEIFLDVFPRPEQPFIVHSAGAQVKVLGTRFNIRNTGDDPFINVALTQGSIRFTSENNISYILQPGQRLRFDKQLGLINQIERFTDYEAVEGWTKGRLLFTNTKLRDVFKRLEEYYGIHFTVSGKVNLDMPLTATIDNMPLPKVLDMMAFSTNLQFRLSDGMVTVRSSQ